MLVYNIQTGDIIAEIPDDSDPYLVLEHRNETKNNIIGTLVVSTPIRKLSEYRIVNGELIRLKDQEIQELRLYGKILTEEERQLNKLKPSNEEIKKAENTIEILTLIQEVM